MTRALSRRGDKAVADPEVISALVAREVEARLPGLVALEVDRSTPVVVAKVVAHLARALGASTEAPYSTRKGCGPIGVPDREWKKMAPKIPGAMYAPGSRRWITVPRGTYAAWVATRESRHVEHAEAANDRPPRVWSPEVAYATARAGGEGRR